MLAGLQSVERVVKRRKGIRGLTSLQRSMAVFAVQLVVIHLPGPPATEHGQLPMP